MIIIMDLKDTQRELRTILAELKVQAKRFPSFGIMRTRSRGREIYCKIDYSSGKRKRTIIDHEGVEYRNLLRGLCISAKMELVEQNLKMVTDFKKIYKDISQLEIIELMAGKYPRIDRQDIIEAINELEVSKLQPSDWALAQYCQSTYKEEEKTHTTSRGLKVRSKSEAAICEVFYELGIEFRYEEVIYIEGRKLIPDFTIRRKSDGKIFYWEHFGLMDTPGYRARYREKMDLYEFGGIVPWDNLITTFDKDGNIDLDYVKAIAGTILAA